MNNLDPIIVFTALAFAGMTGMLVLGVWRFATRPPSGESFDKVLQTITTESELSSDETALTASYAKKPPWTWNRWWLDAVEKAGREPADISAPGRTALISCLVVGFFGVFVFPTGLAGILLPIILIVIVRIWLSVETAKRRMAMEKQLPLLLSSLRSNIHAGITVQAALLHIADDLPAPLGDEIRQVKDEVNVSVPLEVALNRMSERVPSRIIQFLVASIGIAIRSGSDLVPQLTTIEDIVRQRARIAGKIRSAVALAKPTSYLALAAPPLLFLWMSFTEKGYVAYFFGPGLLIFFVAIMLYVAGAVFVRYMVSTVEKI